MIHPLRDLFSEVKPKIALPETAKQAFIYTRDPITKIALFTNLDPSAFISLITGPSEIADGPVFQQYIDSISKPLALFSKPLQPTDY